MLLVGLQFVTVVLFPDHTHLLFHSVCFNGKSFLECWSAYEYMGLLRGFAFSDNKGTDQPVHPCSLIRAFVIPLSEGIISRFATSEI